MRSPVLQSMGDAAQTGDQRQTLRARQDGGMSGGAAGFGDDAHDLEALEHERLRGQHFGGHQNHRLVAFQTFARRLIEGELGHDSANHVTDVGHALLEIFVLNLLEQFRVIV